MGKAKHHHKNHSLLQKRQNMPLVFLILIVVAIIFLLSMIFYLISGAFGNFAGFREANLTKEEETREFSSPIFQDDSPQITGSATDSNSQQRSTSNTSTTNTKETTQTNTTSQTDTNGNFVDETVDTVPTIVPTGIIEPVVTQASGLLNTLFGN